MSIKTANTIDALVTTEIEDARAVFTTVGALKPYLDKIEGVVKAFPGADVSTEAGRDAIRSFAHKLSRIKGKLEAEGKKVADDVKALPKIVDANRKEVRDTIEAWQETVRRPLTEWEEAEEKCKAVHIQNLTDLATCRSGLAALSLRDLRQRLDVASKIMSGTTAPDEFAEQYETEWQQTRAEVEQAIAARERYEAEQAELEALRKEKAEREAAEKARLEAEERAARAKAMADAREREDRERQERAKAEAEAAAARAVEQERQRQENEARMAREREEARARDAKHREAVIVAAVQALIDEAGVSPFEAQTCIDAIAEGKIPGARILF